MWRLREKKVNQMNPRAPLVRQRLGAKAIQAPPQQERFQIGNFTSRLLKRSERHWPFLESAGAEKAVQRKAPAAAYTGRTERIWAKVSEGEAPSVVLSVIFLHPYLLFRSVMDTERSLLL